MLGRQNSDLLHLRQQHSGISPQQTQPRPPPSGIHISRRTHRLNHRAELVPAANATWPIMTSFVPTASDPAAVSLATVPVRPPCPLESSAMDPPPPDGSWNSVQPVKSPASKSPLTKVPSPTTATATATSITETDIGQQEYKRGIALVTRRANQPTGVRGNVRRVGELTERYAQLVPAITQVG